MKLRGMMNEIAKEKYDCFLLELNSLLIRNGLVPAGEKYDKFLAKVEKQIFYQFVKQGDENDKDKPEKDK